MKTCTCVHVCLAGWMSLCRSGLVLYTPLVHWPAVRSAKLCVQMRRESAPKELEQTEYCRVVEGNSFGTSAY
eukprot:scaffold35256_cov18-Tisochrysis_lutea.AAC.1